MTRRVMQADFEIQRATLSDNTPGDDQFRLWLDAIPAKEDQQYVLGIRIVDAEEAQRFNRDYRNRDYATNVLSFPADLPEGLPDELRRTQLGDLLICAPVVEREALEQNRPAADHWAHLLGYDHELPGEAVVMESMETEILASLGISDPYVDIT
jgi:probable rRNA maturation factor